jgi:hypothetical protein
MTEIITLFTRIKTGNNGTNGDVFVGIGGREFCIDSGEPDPGYDDFEKNDDRTYICGEMPALVPPDSTQIKGSSFNDPRSHFPLDTNNLDEYPVYLRFEQRHDEDLWRLQYVSVDVFTPGPTLSAKYEALDADDDEINLVLGPDFGNFVYLHKVSGEPPPT